jgi:SAM-dependent methyltransferase
VARLIFDQAQPGDAVLSIGCGLGMVEHFLLEMSGGAMELEVTDTSSAALIWLKNEMPPHRVHLGLVPGCLPPGKKYQLIYLSAVDYALAQPVWLKLLEEIRSLLAPGGKCLIISPSLEPDKSFWRRALEQGKEAAKILLEIAGLHRRGQFWGWARTREEYRRSFRQAGFARIADGFSAPEQSAGTYWISGEKAA